MSSYKITGVRVEVRPGLTVTAEVATASQIDLLADLKAEGFESALIVEKTRPPSKDASSAAVEDSPVHRIEVRASLMPGKLTAAKIIGFKDDVPQLLRPNTSLIRLGRDAFTTVRRGDRPEEIGGFVR